MHIDTFNSWSAIYEQSTGGVTRKIATHLLSLLPPFSPSSVVLDNAAGPGIVTSEILKTNPPDGLTINLVDASPAMVDIARNIHSSDESHHPNTPITCAVMPGEALDFPDETFTHSITNIGILVFKDGKKDAREIYRTLKRDGGVAVVTSWSRKGFAKPLAEASLAVRPEEEGGKPFRLPIDHVWFDPGYLNSTMREAGFDKVEMKEITFGFGVRNLPLLLEAFRPEIKKALQGWGEDEFERMKELFITKGEEVAEVIEGDLHGELALKMTASIAICRK
ncbi:S-adenosyl-L-methionine-dependent methyltransferase [Cladorrhinum sp. PSN259]|nr:S-adenosyl-L-methionine-dependent methyltransferase [Cladorrhinum sp. PSN259]